MSPCSTPTRNSRVQIILPAPTLSPTGAIRSSAAFFGNGLVGWIPVISGTSTQAMSDAGYLLTNSALTTVTLPANRRRCWSATSCGISGAGAGGWQVLPNPGQSIIGNFNSYRSSTISSSGNGGDWHCIAAGASGAPSVCGGQRRRPGLLVPGFWTHLESDGHWQRRRLVCRRLFSGRHDSLRWFA